MADLIRLRLSDEQALTVRAYRPAGYEQLATSPAHIHEGSRPSVTPAPEPVVQVLAYRPVIALIEAVPSGVEELALAAASILEGAGVCPGVICLDGQNRLAVRMGIRDRAPALAWQQALPELPVACGSVLVVPGPDNEAAISSAAVAAVLDETGRNCGGLVVDLGCRWEPRLFRPVLSAATHIWLVVRSGSWSGAEMRLEQAEFSGWTDMERVRVVVAGPTPPPPGLLGAPAVNVLPALGGAAARAFVTGEVGRLQR